jgi:uncharacterized membrane protein
MSRRVIVAAALALVLGAVAAVFYLRSGKPVRIEITGTEGLRWKGTIEADGAQLEFAGPVLPKSSRPNQIRAASVRHIEFTIEKEVGDEGELVVDVFRDDEPVLNAKAGEGLRLIRGSLSPRTGSIGASAK